MPRLSKPTPLHRAYGAVPTLHERQVANHHGGDVVRHEGLSYSVPQWSWMGSPQYVYRGAAGADVGTRAHNLASMPSYHVRRPPVVPPTAVTSTYDNSERMAALHPVASKYANDHGQLGAPPIMHEARSLPPAPFMVEPQVTPQHGPQPHPTVLDATYRAHHARHPLAAAAAQRFSPEQQYFRLSDDSFPGSLLSWSVEVPAAALVAIVAFCLGVIVAMLLQQN